MINRRFCRGRSGRPGHAGLSPLSCSVHHRWREPRPHHRPGDSLCFNNVRDFPGLGPDYVCRTVRVVALAAGVLTIEAISSSDGTRPNLAVETVNVPLQWRIEYPASIPVTAGTEVMANIEMATPLLDRQSYLLTSTLALSQP